MSSQVNTKVRIVRCPKCRQVLAELPEVTLYKCGGCGTVLQAKSRRNEISIPEPSPQVTDSVAKNQQDEDLEATRPEVKSLSDKDSMIWRDENGDSDEDEQAPTSSSLHTNRIHRWNQDKPVETNQCATSRNRIWHEDNIKLLRTVSELKDHLNRMNFSQVRRLPYNLQPNHNLACLHCCTKHYASSEAFLWGHDTKPERRRHEEEDVVERVQYFAGKRHVRPVAGGAPVVTCYYCSELLYLPSEFLLFRRKCHRLMCHACKEVLRFSLREGTHIVPFESVKPLSGFKQVDLPVSFEDRKMKSIWIEDEDKIDESAGPSSSMPTWRKVESEIVEILISPLHQLMGYSSLSQMLDR